MPSAKQSQWWVNQIAIEEGSTHRRYEMEDISVCLHTFGNK